MRRTIWILAVAILAVAAAGLIVFELGTSRRIEIAKAPPPQPARPAPAPPAAPAAAPAIAPSFDAVHVGPDGKAVIAGRAAPGADVTILDRGKEIGHVTADQNGEFVFIPDKPLEPGPQELSLSSRGPGEAAPVPSAKSLAILVPEHPPGTAPEPPVALLLPQKPDEAARAVQLQARGAHRVTLDMVEYDPSGRIVFTGRADAGAGIDLAVNGRHIGAAAADAGGNWSSEVAGGVPVGRYRLQVDTHGPGAAPPAHLTLELRRAAPGEFGEGAYLAVVPGNTLWHLALRSFGAGLRYVEIYRANRDRIEDPDRIYPNELLALPSKR